MSDVPAQWKPAKGHACGVVSLPTRGSPSAGKGILVSPSTTQPNVKANARGVIGLPLWGSPSARTGTQAMSECNAAHCNIQSNTSGIARSHDLQTNLALSPDSGENTQIHTTCAPSDVSPRAQLSVPTMGSHTSAAPELYVPTMGSHTTLAPHASSPHTAFVSLRPQPPLRHKLCPTTGSSVYAGAQTQVPKWTLECTPMHWACGPIP